MNGRPANLTRVFFQAAGSYNGSTPDSGSGCHGFKSMSGGQTDSLINESARVSVFISFVSRIRLNFVIWRLDGGKTPLPIPNREVKTTSADDNPLAGESR